MMKLVSPARRKIVLAGMMLATAVGQVFAAVEVEGIKVPDRMSVSGKELVLNGAGPRNKSVIKVYAAGLYLQEAKNTVDGVMKAEGPRRMRLVMLMNLSSDDLGMAFMAGLSANISEADKAKILPQISKYGEMFGQVGMLKKGDIIDTDWIPGVGNQCYLNGKQVGPTLPDVLFYNSVLSIWLGNKPVDSTLKTKLLAGAKK
jgi:hypothetical protein